MKNSPKESLESHLFKEGCPTMYLAVYCWPRAKHIHFFPLQTRAPSYLLTHGFLPMLFFVWCSGAPLPIQVFGQKHRVFFHLPWKLSMYWLEFSSFISFQLRFVFKGYDGREYGICIWIITRLALTISFLYLQAVCQRPFSYKEIKANAVFFSKKNRKTMEENQFFAF